MLILEGADGVGKTTFAKKLLKAINDRSAGKHVYAHFTRLPKGFDRYWGYRERASRFIVQDRYHISELAYAPARGDKPGLSPEEYRLVDGHLRTLGAMTVLIAAEPEFVASRWDSSQMFSREATVTAAEVYYNAARFKFIQLPGSDDIYEPDMDFIIHVGGDKPYATEDDLERIVKGYFDRQQTVSNVALRRPFGL